MVTIGLYVDFKVMIIKNLKELGRMNGKLVIIIFGGGGVCCVLLHELSLVVESRAYPLVVCTGFSLLWLLFLQNTGFRAHSLQQLSCTGLVVPQHVGSYWTKDRTRVSCISRQIFHQ